MDALLRVYERNTPQGKRLQPQAVRISKQPPHSVFQEHQTKREVCFSGREKRPLGQDKNNRLKNQREKKISINKCESKTTRIFPSGFTFALKSCMGKSHP